jgi:hypothetical protein
VEERRLRVGSVFEWAAAALGVIALLWVISVPVQRLLGPGVEAAIADARASTPPGVPSDAVSVSVMWLLDGREIRHGDLHTRLEAMLPAQLADGPAQISQGELGERHTRAYVVNGTRFYVVCDRLEPGGPPRVAGIYLP